MWSTDPDRSENEERSAQLAERALIEAESPSRVPKVARLVRLTMSHDPQPGDTNGEVLCDADLAGLAGSRRVRGLRRRVREEYSFIPDAAFREGRAAVLRQLLGLPRLSVRRTDSPVGGHRTKEPDHGAEAAHRVRLQGEARALGSAAEQLLHRGSAADCRSRPCPGRPVLFWITVVPYPEIVWTVPLSLYVPSCAAAPAHRQTSPRLRALASAVRATSCSRAVAVRTASAGQSHSRPPAGSRSRSFPPLRRTTSLTSSRRVSMT